MRVQAAKRMIMLREWATQINEREESGMSVRQWCVENGLKEKTYYYRQKQVREELLEALVTENAIQLPVQSNCLGVRTSNHQEKPVFAELPMPKGKGAAITVWFGGCAVDIQNGADAAQVEQVLRAVSRL